MLRYLKQLAGESLIYGVSVVLSKFLGFFLVPVYTRVFAPEDYGALSLITTGAILVTILATLALDNSAHRWFWDTENELDRKQTISSWMWCQFVVSGTAALVICLFARPISHALIGNDSASASVILAAVNLPLAGWGSVLENWLRMRRKPGPTAALAGVSTALSLGLAVLFVVVMRMGLVGVFLAPLITSVLRTLVAVAVLREWVSTGHFRVSRLREMLRFALPLIPAALAFWVVNSADRYFVRIYCTQADVGIYSAGANVAAMVTLITGAFQLAWGPFAMSIHKQDHAREVYARVFLAYIMLACLVVTSISLFAPQIVQLFATKRYLAGNTVVPFLCFSYLMVGLGYIAVISLSISKNTGPMAIAAAIAAVVNIALNVLLVPRLGKNGAALTALVSQTVIPLYLFVRGNKAFHIPYRFAAGGGVLAYAMLVSFGLPQLPGSSGSWGIALRAGAVLAFLPVAYALRIVGPEHVRALLARRGG